MLPAAFACITARAVDNDGTIGSVLLRMSNVHGGEYSRSCPSKFLRGNADWSRMYFGRETSWIRTASPPDDEAGIQKGLGVAIERLADRRSSATPGPTEEIEHVHRIYLMFVEMANQNAKSQAAQRTGILSDFELLTRASIHQILTTKSTSAIIFNRVSTNLSSIGRKSLNLVRARSVPFNCRSGAIRRARTIIDRRGNHYSNANCSHADVLEEEVHFPPRH